MRVNTKNAVAYLLIGIAYVVSGKAALMLALPPGYASAIFPPAGIAVAAVFIAGTGTLPWVFLGSFFLNLWVDFSGSHQITETGLIAASIIAAASMLQAAVGGWGLRRVIGYPAAFDNVRHIFGFLLLAPLICLISASLSVSGLFFLGIFDTNSLAGNWVSWWIGDSLGVMVLLPVTMVFAGEPRALWRGRIATMAIPMAFIFVLFVLMFLKTNQWEREESLAEFRQVSQQSLLQIRSKLEEQTSVLMELRSLMLHDAQGKVSRQEFHRFTQDMLARYPMIQALEWAPRIEPAQRASFEAAQRKEMPGFGIKEYDVAEKSHRAEAHRKFYPVTYIEPLAGNELALGFDLASSRHREEALAKAGASGLPTTSAPIRLVQTPDLQTGMLIIQSVKQDGHEVGAVLSVLKIQDFIDRTLPSASVGLHVRLIDSEEPHFIYDNFATSPQQIFFERAFDFGGRHYRLQTMPTAAYFKQHRGWQSWGVLAMGTFGTGLLGALLLLGTGYTARVVKLVDERTKELQESESRFRNTMENAPIGMGLATLDGHFIRVNRALCTILGYRRDELEKMSIREVTHPEDMVSSNANIRRLLDGEIDSYRQEKRYLRKDGEVVWVQLTASIERDGAGMPLYLIGQIEDISERRMAEEALRTLSTAIEQGPASVVITDTKGNIQYVNPRFSEVTGYTATEAIGQNPRILQSGQTPRHTYLALWDAITSGAVWHGELFNKSKHGRLYWEEVHIAPVKNPAGVITNYVGIKLDITERKATEEKMRHMANYDQLTDLPNRTLISDRLRRSLAIAKRDKRRMALMFLDLDKFKPINDELGHDVGDLVLKEAARRMLACIRDSDSVGRVGGDEFVVLLPNIEVAADAIQVAEKIRHALGQPFVVEGRSLDISSSVGIAIYPEHGDDEQVLVKNADLAMYYAKKRGRDNVSLFQPDWSGN